MARRTDASRRTLLARIVITTFGSSGDLNPFLALALWLRARGHDVHFATEALHHPRLTEHGFAVTRLTGDPELMLAPYGREMFGGANPIPSLKVLYQQFLIPTLKPRVEELRALCAGADMLVSSAQQLAPALVAELTGIPWVSVPLNPVVITSGEIAALTLPRFLEPAWKAINRGSLRLVRPLIRRYVDNPINAVRREYGLPSRYNLLTEGGLSRRLTAVATSPTFLAPPHDWPTWVKMTGFCFWDTPETWHEPEALAAFFAGPMPVVALSSGSMSELVPHYFDRFFRTSLSAIWQAGARALVIGAPAGALPEPLPPWVFSVPYAPFSRVYPRCAATIHHGGIGTIAQALRAGIPSLIVPWGADQFFNGSQVERIGAGKWSTRRHYTDRRATQALRALLTGPRYRQTTQRIAAQIAQEDGVAALCDAIEAAMPQRTASPVGVAAH